MIRIALFCSVLCTAVAASAQVQLLSVMPLETKRAGIERAQASSLEESIRTVAGDVLSRYGITVLTSETQFKLLEDNGVDPVACEEASCHLDAAQEMKASYFISGVVTKEDEYLVGFVRFHESKTGSTLAAIQVEGKSIRELRKAFEAEAPKFFAKAGFQSDSAPTPTPGPTPSPTPTPGPAPVTGPGKGLLTVLTDPPGAVLLDGLPIGTTPIMRKSLDSGAHLVNVTSPGLVTITRSVQIDAGQVVQINERFLKQGGFVEITTVPPDARVTVDGAAAGQGKQGPYGVGKHTVRADLGGYKSAELAVDVANGDTKPIELKLEALPGRLVVAPNVDAACEVAGRPITAKPDAPGVLELVMGDYEIVCRREDYDELRLKATVGPGKATAVQVQLQRKKIYPPGTAMKEEKVGYELVQMPGGAFSMGCARGDDACFPEEKPKSVTVKPFLVGKTEVTVGAYAKCVSAGACEKPGIQPNSCNWPVKMDHPVNCVDRAQAEAFCGWIGGRLPSPAEWEYAAKSGEDRVYPWGRDKPTDKRANFCDRNCTQVRPSADYADRRANDGFAATAPVGTYPAGASKWGLLDLVGNVTEWTSGKVADGRIEVRGGGFADIRRLRPSYHGLSAPQRRDDDLGFRCVK